MGWWVARASSEESFAAANQLQEAWCADAGVESEEEESDDQYSESSSEDSIAVGKESHRRTCSILGGLLLIAFCPATLVLRPVDVPLDGRERSLDVFDLDEILRRRPGLLTMGMPADMRSNIMKLDAYQKMGLAPRAEQVVSLADSIPAASGNSAVFVKMAHELPRMRNEADGQMAATDDQYMDALYGAARAHHGGGPGAARGGPEAIKPEEGKFPPGSYEHTSYYARCGININQNLIAITSAGLSIEGATRACNQLNETMWDRNACASDITNVFTSLAWMASFLSLAPSWCSLHAYARAGCASDWGWSSGNALAIMCDGFGIPDDCAPGANGSDIEPIQDALRRLMQDEEQDEALLLLRRTMQEERLVIRRQLQEAQDRFEVQEARREHERRLTGAPIDAEHRSRIVNCINHVNGLATLLSKVGFDFWGTTRRCFSITSPTTRVLCSSAVVNLISFFPWLGQNLAGIVGICPTKSIPKAYCAADILDISASIISFGSWAQTVWHDCHWYRGR